MTRIVRILLLGLIPLTSAATEYPATLGWHHILTISTPLSGKIHQIKVAPGETFKQGALLVSLDRRPYQAALKRSQSELQRLEASLKDAERELNRAKALFERTVLSTTDLQAAELAFNTQQAEYDLAQAKLTQAEIDLEYSQMRAPFSGIVLEQLAQPGEVIVNQCQITPILRIAPIQTLVVRAQISMSQRSRLKPGESLVAVIHNKRYEGKIEKIAVLPQITPGGSNKYQLDVELPFSDTLLPLMGNKGTIEIP